MSQERELFPILQDANGASEAPHRRIEGEAAAAQKGLIGFSFKDASGNVILPQLNNEGAIIVSSDAGTCLTNIGEVLSGAQTKDVEAQCCAITLTADMDYSKMIAKGSSTRLTLWRVAYVDDVGVGDTETELGKFITSSGHYNFEYSLACFDTASGTGVQELRLYGTPCDKVSDIFGSLSVNEIA